MLGHYVVPREFFPPCFYALRAVSRSPHDFTILLLVMLLVRDSTRKWRPVDNPFFFFFLFCLFLIIIRFVFYCDRQWFVHKCKLSESAIKIYLRIRWFLRFIWFFFIIASSIVVYSRFGIELQSLNLSTECYESPSVVVVLFINVIHRISFVCSVLVVDIKNSFSLQWNGNRRDGSRNTQQHTRDLARYTRELLVPWESWSSRSTDPRVHLELQTNAKNPKSSFPRRYFCAFSPFLFFPPILLISLILGFFFLP